MNRKGSRPDPRKNPIPVEKIEIHKVKLQGDPDLDHCWVPFVGNRPLEFEDKCTSVDAAKNATARHFGCERGELRFAVIS